MTNDANLEPAGGTSLPDPDPADVVRELREQALTITAADVDVTPGPGHERVWAVFMELGYTTAVATLVSFADGTTSLYFSNGGGLIGAGTHPTVREAAQEFIAVANALVDQMTPTDAHPLPSIGRVRFYARTFTDLRTAEGDEEELESGRHVLSRLFVAGHAVIADIRESSGSE